MTSLSVKERDLLQRINDKEDLRPLFFRKAKGVKWFDSLLEQGYFKSEYLPKPTPAKEEGHVNIPHWHAIDYLVNTAPELADRTNDNYAIRILKILVDVTSYAKESKISNYRTWWQFSEIILHIPHELILVEQVSMVDYWLGDNYDRGLVSNEVGIKWLPKLLDKSDTQAQLLASKLLEALFKVEFSERTIGKKTKKEPLLRCDENHAQEIIETVAYLAGERLGKRSVLIFESQLKKSLSTLKNDSWSSIWQPAIENHEQNKYRSDPENVLVGAFRDSLKGYLFKNPNEANEFVKGLLNDKYQTIHRLTIHAVNTSFDALSNLVDTLLDKKYLEPNYRHEMWQLLNCNYQKFSESQKLKMLSLISDITRADDEGLDREGATAYAQSIWLAAVKHHGEKELALYNEKVTLAGTEPEHPDFSSYMSVGWGGSKSPIHHDELQSLSIEKLVEELNNYVGLDGLREPNVEGLANAFMKVVKLEPLKFSSQLNKFIEVDFAYIYKIIEAFRELWDEKAKLPWDDVFKSLLTFCASVIKQERFWSEESTKEREHFFANRCWIVSSICRLLVAGTKSDDHAFSEQYLGDAEEIIIILLKNEKGSEFKTDTDAVSLSINSPRGHCVEALINLTLRACRLSDKSNGNDHSRVWTHFQSIYDQELKRSCSDSREYEFATLICNYLPNFLYMSKEWVLNNLNVIFQQDNYLKWLCAMQGYAYVSEVYQEVFKYLKDNGDYLKVLDDENLETRVEDKVVQNIAVAYIHNFESFSDEGSLISTLISRNDPKELGQLIWFIWTMRKNGVENIKNKVYELWPKILKNLDLSTKRDRKLASQLSHWATFIDHLNDENRNLLLVIAPYAGEAYNSSDLLEAIANISECQPFDAYDIWMKMLEGTVADYPEEDVKKILSNLVNKDEEGLRKAKEIVSIYLKHGNERPNTWLKVIRDNL